MTVHSSVVEKCLVLDVCVCGCGLCVGVKIQVQWGLGGEVGKRRESSSSWQPGGARPQAAEPPALRQEGEEAYWRMGGVTSDAECFAGVLNVQEWSEWGTDHPLSSVHDVRQGLVVRCCAASEPHRDAASEDALDGASVEGEHDAMMLNTWDINIKCALNNEKTFRKERKKNKSWPLAHSGKSTNSTVWRSCLLSCFWEHWYVWSKD